MKFYLEFYYKNNSTMMIKQTDESSLRIESNHMLNTVLLTIVACSSTHTIFTAIKEGVVIFSKFNDREALSFLLF